MRKSIFTIKNEPPIICRGCKHFDAMSMGGWFCKKLKTPITNDMRKAQTCLFKENKDD